MKRTVAFAAISLLLMLVTTHADTVILNSGGSVKGEIVEETVDKVVVRDPLRGVITEINMDDVAEIKRAAGLEKEYQAKLKQITPGDTYRMMELATWCRRCGLKDYQRELLKRILEIYEDDADAKRELDILDGKLPESARAGKKDSDGITFTPGKGGKLGENKKKYKTRKIWGNRDKDSTGKSSGKYKVRSSKFKPKGATKAAFKGLDWLLKHGPRVKYAPQGQVVSAALAGMACLASKNDRYSGLLDRCMNTVKGGVKRYLTKKRQPKGKFDQCNWALSIGGMFLVEALPYYKTKELKSLLQEICNQLIINMETTGGWGHDASGPNPLNYVEIEVMSNFAVSCLGMCKREGISVPKKKLAEAVAYIEKCVSSRGVGYSHTNRWGHVSRTGGAVFALSMAGAKKSKYPTLCSQLDRMMKNVQTGHASPALSFWQCAIGALQVGPNTWDKYVQTWFPKIMEHQNEDGSFKSIINPKEGIKVESNLGPAYCTAIYSFILLVDRGSLKYGSGCSRVKKK
jgi:hypothetical protein